MNNTFFNNNDRPGAGAVCGFQRLWMKDEPVRACRTEGRREINSREKRLVKQGYMATILAL